MVNIPIAYCKYDDYRQNEVKTLFVELCIKKARPSQESCFFSSVPRAGLEPAQPSLAKGF